MTNSKSTKGALLVSSISLLLCFAMLLGTTFAWFTDSATSKGNKIVAGKLDVQLLMNTGSGYTDISDSTSPIFGEGSIAQNNNAQTLWEPGKTQVAYLAIQNNGNLDLKYNVNLIVKNVAKDLYEVMEYDIIPDKQYDEVTEWTKNGKAVNVGSQLVSNGDVSLASGLTHYFALAIHMNEDAGNEYQEGQVDFDIVVNATQLNSEEDSFDNTYDEDATYELSVGADGKYTTNNMAGLSKIAELASSDSSITSVNYVDAATGTTTEVPVVAGTSALNESIKSNNDVIVVKAGTYNVPSVSAGKEIDIVGTKDTVLSLTGAHTQAGGSTLNFTGITIKGSGYTNGMGNGTKVNYTDCTFNTADMYLYGASTFTNCTFNDCGTYALWTWGASKVEFSGCTFNTTGKALYVNANVLDDGSNHQTVVITNCKFYDTGNNNTKKAAIETGDDYNKTTYDIFITNSIFEGFDVTEDKTSSIQYNYGGSNLGTKVWGNKYLMGTDKLNVVIDGVDVH